MTGAELTDHLNLLVNVSAALLAVSVTLVALVPTVVQLARLKTPDFMAQTEREGSLRRVMDGLALTVVGFTASLICTFGGTFYPCKAALIGGLIFFGVSLVVLAAMSVAVAIAARDVM